MNNFTFAQFFQPIEGINCSYEQPLIYNRYIQLTYTVNTCVHVTCLTPVICHELNNFDF